MMIYYIEYVNGDKVAAEDAAFFLKFADAELWQQSKQRLGLDVTVRAVIVHERAIVIAGFND